MFVLLLLISQPHAEEADSEGEMEESFECFQGKREIM